jgi:hypothetical protein
MPRHGVLRSSFSPGDEEADPAGHAVRRQQQQSSARHSAAQSSPAARHPPRGKRGPRAPPQRSGSGAGDALLSTAPPSATQRVTFDTGGSSAGDLSRTQTSTEEIQFLFFTWDGLQELLSTLMTLLPVLAIGGLIGLVVHYGLGSQCGCSFSQVGTLLPKNLTSLGADHQWDCCQTCWSQPYTHTIEDQWTPTCSELSTPAQLFARRLHGKWKPAVQARKQTKVSDLGS